MIVAVCGHVDHGKTRLVHALTGVDTDRLPEEKRRGMTIEPGFAHLEAGPEPLGFADVPGHEGFLRQAIVGLAASDAALLVVACDDGPMPQTREHLDLLQLLGITRGVVALTKTDRVAPERVAQVRAAVQALVRGTALSGAPLFEVSAARGDGVGELREALLALQADTPASEPHGGFRLAVDRAFSRAGAGTVATGTVISGQVRAGDTLVLSPAGSPHRVRGVQRAGTAVDVVRAGQRCAIALPGAPREQLARGTWLVDPALHAPTLRLDVRLRLLPSAPRPLEGHAQAQLHIGAAALPARLLLLQPLRLEPGEEGWAQVQLQAPVSALHGDRFVLRDPSAHALLGGGVVLDDAPPLRSRRGGARLAELAALQDDDAARVLGRLLELRPGGVDLAVFARQWNLQPERMDAIRQGLDARAVAMPHGPRLVSESAWRALVEAVPRVVDDWHRDHPSRVGIGESALLRALPAASGHRADEAPLRQAAIRAAVADGLLVRDGFLLRRPGHQARLDPQDAALVERVRALLQPTGLRPPPLGELAALLELPVEEASAALARVAGMGHVVQVARNRYFLPETVHALMAVARETAAAAPEGWFDAASFRDRSGVGRNLTIQLLEFFDRIGFTRYRAERRVIAGDPDQKAGRLEGR
ncbi:selenocysteine-specific translation elongation factor [Ramlibacter sp. AW1]|uniref:Selenocysteine-specific elongation factor n=1 Tax=Ramlibacter aurantiacus TaxID=2801330 RepID=A0A936ZEJ0_9BURK|nr:selenocysteine-specific translation elongation factor [Ramlibacter aurantiacus]MBL0420099.1 selenocysteine-specific translation elongation factor [Ramlibacter aurantiacus]